MAMPRQVRSLRVPDEPAHAHVGHGLRSIVLLRWSNHAQAICGLVFSAEEPEMDGVRVSAKAIGSNLLLQL